MAITYLWHEGQERRVPVVDTRIDCPKCKTPHIDEGEWANRAHRTHLCVKCAHDWQPYRYYTRGVE